MKKGVSYLVNLAKSRACKTVVVCAVIGTTMSLAHAEGEALPTGLPDIGAYAVLGIGGVGAVVAVVVGGYTGFLVIKKALKWLNKAFG